MARDTSFGREGEQADRRVGHKVAMWSLVDKNKGHREWSKNVEHSLGPRLALECPPHSVPAQETLPSSPDRELPGLDSSPAKVHQGPASPVPLGMAERSPSQPQCRLTQAR